MYTRMLVPLDGSKLAENVLPYARVMARALDLRVELVSVVDSMDFARTTHAGHVRDFDPLIEAATPGRPALPGGHRPVFWRN